MADNYMLYVRDPNTGSFVSVPYVKGAKGDPGGPLHVAYAHYPYAYIDDNGIQVVNTEYSTDGWEPGMRYIGIYVGEIAPIDDKSQYEWVEIPKGDRGEKGERGTTGPQGEKGDSIRFAYSREPYRRESINQNGVVDEIYNFEYSRIWEEGMDWLGLYSGNAEPSDKKDYVWIQLPSGKSGDGPIKITYAKSTVHNIETVTKLCYLAEYNPTKSYFYEDVSLLAAKDFKTDDNEGDGRYVLMSSVYGYTLMTNKKVYMAQDTIANGLGAFLVTKEDDEFYRRVGAVPPGVGYFTDTGNFLSKPVSNAIYIPGAMTLKGEGSIYCYEGDNGVQQYYRVATTVAGLTKYPIVRRNVGATFKRTGRYFKHADLNSETATFTRYTNACTVVGNTGSTPFVVKVDYTNASVYYLLHVDIYNQHYPHSEVTSENFERLMYSTIVQVYELLEGDPDNEVYYIPTEIMIDASATDLRLWHQTDLMTTTNEGPIYVTETMVYNEKPKYAIMYQKLDSYEHMTYFTEYNPDADFMGIYIGNKTELEPTDYQWIKIKGSTGRTGGPVFIRYAAEANDTSGVAIVDIDSIDTVWHEGLTYIGIGVGEAALADEYGEGNNSDSSIYNWIPLFKGIKGDKGDPGQDGKPSAMLFKFAPLPNIDDMSDVRRETDIYIGICKDAYYDPVTNKAVTDNNTTENYLWLELPDSDMMGNYGSFLTAINNRTYVDVEELDLDSGEMVTKSRPVNEVVQELHEVVGNRVDTTDALEINLESLKVTCRKVDNANVDKLNVAVGYMRELLKRIRTLENQHIMLPSSGSIELPYFDYSTVGSENTPTNTSFSAHVKLNSNNRYDTYYMSTLCTNDSTVWVKLKTGYESILSDTDVYLYRVPLDPNEEIVRVQLNDTDYVASNGYYWYLLFKSNTGDLLLQPMAPSVPESLYDYLIIERDEPTDA